MAKVTGGLLSLSASGSIAEALVFGSWKGISTVRQYVKPANPQTTAQTAVRTPFTWLNRVYKTAPAGFQAPWQSYVSGQPLTQRNAFVKFNLPNLIGVSDVQAMTFSPGSNGGLALASPSFTPGDDQITVACSAPTLPDGWSMVSMHAAAIADQDPDSGILYDIIYDEDTSDPYSLVLSVADATAYVVGAWGEFLRPDGVTAFGPASMGTATST
jgi:hypothetical protein